MAASCSALIRGLPSASVTAAGAPSGAGDLCLTTPRSSEAHLDSAEMRCKERLMGKVTQPLLDDQMNNQEQPVGMRSFFRRNKFKVTDGGCGKSSWIFKRFLRSLTDPLITPVWGSEVRSGSPVLTVRRPQLKALASLAFISSNITRIRGSL